MGREFITPAMILTGRGCLADAGKHLAGMGKKALVVCGQSAVRHGSVARLGEMLAAQDIAFDVYDGVTDEPTDVMVFEGLDKFRTGRCDFLVAIGGGSPIDAMKGIAMMHVCPGRIAEYMGIPIDAPLPRMVAIPTTAGTGSEVTKICIITDTGSGVKMLLAGGAFMPTLAIVDPDLGRTAPAKVSISAGLDALTHAIEAYTSKKAQPLSDTLALSAIRRIFANLRRVIQDGDDMDGREQMALAALEAGMAFSNSSVTLVHGMSRPIGALFHVPHGLSNAMLLHACLNFAVEGCRERFAVMGRRIGVVGEDAPEDVAAASFLDALNGLRRACAVPTLAEYGIPRDSFFAQIDKMADDAIASGSIDNTLRPMNKDAVKGLYREVYQ